MSYSYETNAFYLYDYPWFDCSDSLDNLNAAVASGDHIAVKSKASLETGGALQLSKALKQSRGLKGLCLYYANVGEEGALHLANALRSSPMLTLQTLDLRGSGLGDVGVAHLAAALKTNRSVEYLDLFSNGITDDGAVDLAEMLGVNKTLLYFWCEGNAIGQRGTVELAESLQHCALVAFSLNGNPSTNEGLKAIVKALAENETLQILWTGNGEGFANAFPWMQDMHDAMLRNTTLIELHSGWLVNGAIHALLARNKRLLESKIVRRTVSSKFPVTLANVLMVHTNSSLEYPKDFVLGVFNPPVDNVGVAVVKTMYNDGDAEEVDLRKPSTLFKDYVQGLGSVVKAEGPDRAVQACGCCWGKVGEEFQTPKGIPKFKVNERVQCLWLDTNTPYQGTISRKEGDAYDVNYDDGDFEANANARKIYHHPHKDIKSTQDYEKVFKSCGVSLKDLLTAKNMIRCQQRKENSLFNLYHIGRNTSDQDLVHLVGEDFNYACVVFNLDLLHTDPTGETSRIRQVLEHLLFYSCVTYVFCVGKTKEDTVIRKGDYTALSRSLQPLFEKFSCLQWNVEDNLTFYVNKASVWNSLLTVIPKASFSAIEFAKVEDAAKHLSLRSNYLKYDEIKSYCRDKDIKKPEVVVQMLRVWGCIQINPWTHRLRKAIVDVNVLHRFLQRLHHLIKSIRTYGTRNLEGRFEKVGLRGDLQSLEATSVASLDILRFVWGFEASESPNARGFKENDPVACLLPHACVLMGRIAAINHDGSYDVIEDSQPGVRHKKDESMVRAYTDRGAYSVNDFVICTWGADHTYYQAHVHAVHSPTNYDVAFDDGDFESNVHPSRIRFLEEQPPLLKTMQPNRHAELVPQVIDMMQFKLLLHPWVGKATRHEKAYMVSPDPSMTVPLGKRTDSKGFSSVHFDFHKGGIPRGVFYRVAVSLHNFIADEASSTLFLFSDFAELRISPKRSVYLDQEGSVITLFVKNKIDGTVALNLATAQLKKINSDNYKSHPLRYTVSCKDPNGRRLSLSKAHIEKLAPWFDSTERVTTGDTSPNFV